MQNLNEAVRLFQDVPFFQRIFGVETVEYDLGDTFAEDGEALLHAERERI